MSKFSEALYFLKVRLLEDGKVDTFVNPPPESYIGFKDIIFTLDSSGKNGKYRMHIYAYTFHLTYETNFDFKSRGTKVFNLKFLRGGESDVIFYANNYDFENQRDEFCKKYGKQKIW